MTADLARMLAAQAAADKVVRAVADTPDGSPVLLVAVTDPETGQRLATGFVTYQTVPAPLRLVTS
jgi:predicted transcriptional regulator